MSTQIKSLQEAVQTPVGSYVSGGFQAVVANAKSLTTKTGKTMYKAKLQEGGLTIDATSFATDFQPHIGKLVKFVGMGIKRGDDYNGVPQLSIGDKARWIPAGDAPTQTPAPAPAQQSASAPTHAQGVIPGVTVGMAINKAVDIALKTGDANEETIYYTASMLIRLSDKLQRGELAPENPADENQPF